MTSGDSARKRKRGIVLTDQGVKKLRDAIAHLEDKENFGQKLTIAALSIHTRLTPDTVAKVLDADQGVDRRTLDSFFRAFNLELSEHDYCHTGLQQTLQPQGIIPAEISFTSQVKIDWGEASAVSMFYGRTQELETLARWVHPGSPAKEQSFSGLPEATDCRLIMVLGMGGIGKTCLVAKLIEQMTSCNDSPAAFQSVVWRSLCHAPTVEEKLTGLIRAISHQPDIDLPKALNPLISRLLQCLKQRRCLLVLDNMETILQAGEHTGCYRQGFAGYEELIRRVGESSHKSCLILISRERPKEIGWLETKNYPIRSLLLKGLQPQDALKLLQAEGIDPTEAEAQILQSWYAGNPLKLKIAATTIRFLFLNDIDCLLVRGITAFGDIYDLLDQQFERLCELEKTVLYWLAIHREPVSLPELIDAIVPLVPPYKLLATLENLSWRSFIESSSTGFTLQNVVMEYVTSRFVEQVRDELENGIINLFNRHALLQATATVNIREIQTQLILKPIADRATVTEIHWANLLQTCRSQPHLASGYTAGNLLNLLYCCNQDLSRYDFSKLTIRQADLRQMNLQQVNFDQANFIRSLVPNSLL
jgi:hypothetical protein